MKSTNSLFHAWFNSKVRWSLVIFQLAAVLTNCWGLGQRGQVSGAPNQRTAPPVAPIRSMPANNSAFLVDQRFDIRVEAPAGVSSPLRVSLDGRDITEWNNRSHLTRAAILFRPSPTLTGASAFLSRDWSFAQAGRHTLKATADGAATSEVSFEIVN